MSTNDGNGGQKTIEYWDPSASTVKKYTETSANGGYADILESKGLAKNFTGLSELLLGQAQPAQFQSGSQYGANWSWGSSISNDGTFVEIANPTRMQILKNPYTEMPRSYYFGANGFGAYYNYYAATAETGIFSNSSNTNADDSLCPNGWRLPTSTGTKSWQNLITTTYGLNSSVESSLFLRRISGLSLAYSGKYASSLRSGGRDAMNLSGDFESATGSIGDGAAYDMYFRDDYISPINNDVKAYGYPIRCVMD